MADALNLDGIVEDLKFAAEAGSDFDYEIDETDPENRTVHVTVYGDEGDPVEHYRMWVSLEKLDGWDVEERPDAQS